MSPISRTVVRTLAAGVVAFVVFVCTGAGAFAASLRPAYADAGRTPAGGAPALAAWPAAAVVPGLLPMADTMDFTSSFDLDPDGGVTVHEQISYTFDPNAGERHGILRGVVVRQETDDPHMFRSYAISDVTVSSSTGAPTDLLVEEQAGAAVLRIGSPDQTVRGTHRYDVRYHLANVMNAFADRDEAEFFYNVFKDDSVEKSRVELQVGAPAAALDVRCEHDGQDCFNAVAGNPSTFMVTFLSANEDLTIALKYPLGAFREIAPDLRRGTVTGGELMDANPAKAVTVATLAGAVLAPLLAIGGMGALVATRGRDEWYAGLTPGLTPGAAGRMGRRGRRRHGAESPDAPVTRTAPSTFAVQFTPPPGVQPGLVGTIVDERADTVDVSATLIDLSVRGYLQIEEIQSGGILSRTDWQLTRLFSDAATADPPLRPYEEKLLRSVFATGTEIKLSSLKNRFASTLESVKGLMYDEALQRGWFRKSPSSQRGRWHGLGFALSSCGLATGIFFGNGSSQIDRAAGFDLPISSGWMLGGSLVLAGVIVQILGGRMAAKTAEGSAVLAQSLGFKRYLETAEANQIKWEEAQQIFSAFLPYAIVFGVSERWAQVFEEVAAAAAAAGHPVAMPSWYRYHGRSIPDFGSITSAVDSFATAASGTFTSTPGSSGKSGFSSGGSFSGGGVGGSRSGSW